jgi:DNA-binding FadR family transcriptional regulator
MGTIDNIGDDLYAPIKRPDLVALVTESLRQQILDGVHPPGSELPAQGKLAATYNVSVNVIREAMRNLRSLGMVEVSQGKCPQVKGMNTEASIDAFCVMLCHAGGSLYHLIEARTPLEIQIATLAAERATPADLTKIARALEDMKAAQDAQALVKCDQAFHYSLAAATGNPLLMVMVETMAGLQCRLTAEAHSCAGITAQSIAEHEQILAAIQNHDERTARQAMLKHMEAVLQRLPADHEASAPLMDALEKETGGARV